MNNKKSLKVGLVVLVSLIWSLKASAIEVGDAYAGPVSGIDSFGITQFYPTKSGYQDWESTLWNNGNPRNINNSFPFVNRDPDDLTGWSNRRGSGTLDIDGNGILTMGGSQPRIYVNPYAGDEETNPDQFFKNIESTVYYRRTGTDGANWGGLIIGLRTGPSGHSSYGDYCDATTYYARFRHDGKWDFEKELKHPGSSSTGYNNYLPDGILPSDQWIGMKYLAYNIENDTKVKLDLWIDLTSNGDVSNGGAWTFIGSKIDDGNWDSGSVSGCSYEKNKIILNGGGVAFIRNTGIEKAEYKYFSVREITTEIGIPVVNAGGDQSITWPSNTVVLAGTVTDDDEPEPYTSLWTVIDGPGVVAFNDATKLTTTVEFSQNGIYTLQLMADDGLYTAYDQLVITVYDANKPPVVNTGAAQTITLPSNSVVLTADVQDDGRPNPYTALWTIIDGPGDVNFTDATRVNASVDFSASGTYRLQLMVDDGEFTASDELIITVNPADFHEEVTPVSYVASSDDGHVAENVFDDDVSTRWSALGSGENLMIDLGAQYSVTELYVAWHVGDQRQSHYQVDISDDALEWTTVNTGSSSGESLDFEYISLYSSGRYVRIIGLGNTANDWNSITEIKVFAEVGDVNRPPVVTVGDDQLITWPSNSVVVTGSVTDDGKPMPYNVQWAKISGSGIVFFDDATALNTRVEFSESGIYTLQLMADDGELTAHDNVIITVDDGTQAEEISSVGVEASSSDNNVAENAFDGDLSTRWSALGSGEYLTIDLGGQHNVTALHAAWFKGDQRQADYQINISDDAMSWTTVNAGSSSGESLDLEYISVNSSGRYLRIVGLGNSSNNWNSITEIKIFGAVE